MMISPKFLNPFLTILPLENGDRLSRAEFERRYNAMTEVKKLNRLQEWFIAVPRVRTLMAEILNI